MKKIVVAIDGPAGAGKSTIAKLAAEKLGYAYIDTGAMYRSVAWKFLQTGKPFDEDFISGLSKTMLIKSSSKSSVEPVVTWHRYQYRHSLIFRQPASQ